MNLLVKNTQEVFDMQVRLGANDVLRVTKDGQFIWHDDADRMIEDVDFSFSPAMPHILKALRKRTWVGLTDEEIAKLADDFLTYQIENYQVSGVFTFARAIEAKLNEKSE